MTSRRARLSRFSGARPTVLRPRCWPPRLRPVRRRSGAPARRQGQRKRGRSGSAAARPRIFRRFWQVPVVPGGPVDEGAFARPESTLPTRCPLHGGPRRVALSAPHLPFPFGGPCTGGGTGKGLGCPAPPSPVRRTARGEVRPPSWLSARSLLESAANSPLVNLQLWCRELPKFDKGHAHCRNGQCLRSAAPMMNCLTHMHRTGWPHEFSVGAQCRCGKRRG